jgi:hypothetical protein
MLGILFAAAKTLRSSCFAIIYNQYHAKSFGSFFNISWVAISFGLLAVLNLESSVICFFFKGLLTVFFLKNSE